LYKKNKYQTKKIAMLKLKTTPIAKNNQNKKVSILKPRVASIHILVAVMKLIKFIAKNQLEDKRLTARKLYKLYISQNGSL